jgi:hypothetical protein
MQINLSLVLRILLVILASYRITNLFVLDDGPFDIFKKIRALVGKIAASNMQLRGLAVMFNCPYCLGVWISAIFSLTIFFPSVPVDIGILIFAIAGGQDFLVSTGSKRKD